MLADEVADLASVAQSIEHAVFAIGLDKPLGVHGSNLQRIDFLFQHLEDVAFVLKAMAPLFDDEHTLDTEFLSRAVRLDYIRRRLRADGERHEKSLNSGHIDLF
ncbi:hypothetical protein N4R57_06055 [Rhodobacteraceae bacterium D3-12]|nr:hypothetical protein N4R57_06055 [Rhodobacteraceae bacterium D3-12]